MGIQCRGHALSSDAAVLSPVVRPSGSTWASWALVALFGSLLLSCQDVQVAPERIEDVDGDGVTELQGDCDDTDSAIYPNHVEECNGKDDNCNGEIDEGATQVFYYDEDLDSYGADEGTVGGCDEAPRGTVLISGDCDDSDPYTYPNAQEMCDSKDNDCDSNGEADEWDGRDTYYQSAAFYPDDDGDGYGEVGSDSIQACYTNIPIGYADNNLDCNDDAYQINPSVTEVCDPANTDEDCSGSADNQDPGADESTKSIFYPDLDNDLFGTNNGDYEYFCDDPATDPYPPPTNYETNNQDCDDDNANIHPGVEEICNELDDNCNNPEGSTTGIDENVKLVFYLDKDQDGYGDAASITKACTVPEGYVINYDDCNDSLDTVYPGADEYCNSIDDNCNGEVDENPLDPTTYYRDEDEDTYGNADMSVARCSNPVGYVLNNLDCNDNPSYNGAIIYPDAYEYCDLLDNDCDQRVDEPFSDWVDPSTGKNPEDSDGDGIRDECQEDVCDGLDNNGDGVVDEDFDLDGDGFSSCGQDCAHDADVDNASPTCRDCNDDPLDPMAETMYPGALELCDHIDNDCDGLIDDEDPYVYQKHQDNYYIDLDEDGFGDQNDDAELFCWDPSTDDTQYVTNNDDCNDENPLINAEMEEICDEIDNDCDNVVDEALTYVNYYPDDDSDGFGRVGSQADRRCTAPEGYVEDDTDCDDTNEEINPIAEELPGDRVDQNCDEAELCYVDADDDAYRPVEEDENGDDFYPTIESEDTDCDDSGEAYDNEPVGDCDDENPEINLSAIEFCDLEDNDCDGAVDDNVEYFLFLPDADEDGYGVFADDAIFDCIGHEGTVKYEAQQMPDGTIQVTDEKSYDCDDTDPEVNPAAVEVCDEIDNDCDDVVDEDDAADALVWYHDTDLDGYGLIPTEDGGEDQTYMACKQPEGYSILSGDCNDEVKSIYPEAPEVTGDNIDQSCDGTEVCYQDNDDDGFRPDLTSEVDSDDADCNDPYEAVKEDEVGDCNDDVASINPDADEVCNDIDDNCNGDIDDQGTDTITWYEDLDEDGYGGERYQLQDCDQPTGYVNIAGDCDDTRADVSPDGIEVCDDENADEDCDGFADDDDTAAESTKTTYYVDNDDDGYGKSSHAGSNYCDDPSNSVTQWVTNKLDCDDFDETVNPEGVESVDDDRDQNCDGIELCYLDADDDGYRPDSSSTVESSDDTDCVDSGEAESTDPTTDCDDSSATVYPNADEVVGDSIDEDCDGSEVCYLDADQDGYVASSGTADSEDSDCHDKGEGAIGDEEDCDDTNAGVNPLITEACDGIDNNCDGETDEGFDGDGDGTADCFALEVCDGADNDGDGLIDDADDSVVGQNSYYVDSDGDGFGEASGLLKTCDETAPEGYADTNTDCDDEDEDVNPAEAELCGNEIDDDCDGDVDGDDASVVGQYSYYVDSDGDGFGDENATVVKSCDSSMTGYVTDNTDCDDTNEDVNPDATEVCNSLDDDCDGSSDDDDSSVVDQNIYYEDFDKDGYGDENADPYKVCTSSTPKGYSKNNVDCDDLEEDINPGAPEVCNSQDDDCDGDVDDDDSSVSGQNYYYEDDDEDGYGDEEGTANKTCSASAPDGYVANNTDCDDGDADISPGEPEICDEIDNDCDDAIDDADDSVTGQKYYYVDGDSDGYGDESADPNKTCDTSAPDGYVKNNTDCDDTDADISPGDPEVCDDADNDCDGDIDDDDDSVSGQYYYYADGDSDGYGDENGSANKTCESSAPDGYVANNLDCADDDADISPGDPEVCDDADNDCDGDIDDDDDSVTGQHYYYSDGDEDGYGDENADPTKTCDATAPDGYVKNNGDCDDSNIAINPAADEVCDDADNDCDGLTDDDDGSVSDATTYYLDEDGDGYGLSSSTEKSCETSLSGYADVGGDCNDDEALVSPGEEEASGDGVDNDCDSSNDDDTIFVADSTSSYVYGVDRSDGSIVTTFTGLDGAAGIARDDDGLLYVSGASADTLDLLNPLTEEVTTISSTRDSPEGLWWDSSSQTLLIAEYGGLALTEYDPSVGTFTEMGTTSVGPVALLRLPDDDLIYFTSYDGTYLYSYDPDTATETELVELPAGCDQLVPIGSSALLAVSRTSEELYYISLISNTVSTLSGGYSSSWGLCSDSWGEGVFVLNSSGEMYLASTTVDDAMAFATELGGGWHCTSSVRYDADSDGYWNPQVGGDDCDDLDDSVGPGTETCDGTDEDCDGAVDEGVTCSDDCTASHFGTHGYLFCNTASDLTWANGRAECQAMGYDLATVNGEEENTWLSETSTTEDSGDDWYIGYNDRDAEATFVWSSQEGASYENWSPLPEPDGDAAENCVAYIGDATGNWRDLACSEKHPWICESQDACRTYFFGSHAYTFCYEELSWTDALSACEARGMSLAALTTSDENAFANEKGLLLATQGEWWTGGNDRKKEGTFRWTTAEQFVYTNWTSGAPEESGPDCVHLDVDGTWDDVACSNTLSYICETSR